MTGSNSVIRVIIADDHTVLRAGLKSLLDAQPDIEVVGEAGDGQEAIDQVEAHAPDVVVMDLTMPGMSGVEATEYIADNYPDTQILVLTMHGESQFVLPVLEVGASGYVLKTAADTDLIEGIRRVHEGKSYLQNHAAEILLRQHQSDTVDEKTDESLDVLSERELEVLQLTAHGYSSREIGNLLHISHKTVDTYRHRLMEKLGFNNRVDLVHYALRKGLLELEE